MTERRRRIAARHLLGPGKLADAVGQAADALVGIHATDPTAVVLGVRARVRGFEVAALERALYEERSLVRVLGMRRTMFVTPVSTAGVIQSAVTDALAAAERRRLVGMLAGAAIGGARDSAEAERWLSDVELQTVAALESFGEATAAQLGRRVPGLREQIAFGEGRRWAGKVGVSTRLLFLLATEGRVVRGKPKGTWQSSLYRWAPMDRWVEGGLEPWPRAPAQVELATRWLRAFGPGTLDDLRWWTGWTVGDTRRALASAGARAVMLDGASGFALPDDLELTPEPDPWVALLPALDTTTMGWADRGFYLGDHGRRLFDRNGNAGPTIWVDGRVVGGWAQRPSGEVVVRPLEDIGRDADAALANEAARLQAWLGAARIIPRFRTPVEQELSA